MMPKLEPGSSVYKTSALSVILSLQLQSKHVGSVGFGALFERFAYKLQVLKRQLNKLSRGI